MVCANIGGVLLHVQEVADQAEAELAKLEEQQAKNRAAVTKKVEGGIVEGFGRASKEVGERYTPNF